MSDKMIDTRNYILYNTLNFIRQFVTILSLNKTREIRWAISAHFCFVWVRTAPIFLSQEHLP